MNQLEALGWNGFFAQQLNHEGLSNNTVGRVVEEQKNLYRVAINQEQCWAVLPFQIRDQATSRMDLPVVGDWVEVQPCSQADRVFIQRLLKRQTQFARRAPGGKSEPQVVAANMETVFIVTSLNRDLNLRRLDRYLVLAWESGAVPVILLTKADLCPTPDAIVSQVEDRANGVPIHVLSVPQDRGITELSAYLTAGKTAVLLGSSGVGKSTLLNRLAGGQIQKVREIREDDSRGRHCTSYRRLIKLPGGGMIIDTPGMRELALCGAVEGLGCQFADIERLILACRFSDCRHQTEPDCAVKEALESGELDGDRYRSYLKLQREIAFHQRRLLKTTKKRAKPIRELSLRREGDE